ncbi:hypothetical protein SEA_SCOOBYDOOBYDOO_19 [Mycobacterium phage ScoobyDoobyDoo]|nr:hypothetical protein SEA_SCOOBYDOOBYDOO_19 [Mycobacterium phage ScoobyDoobyDoo]
MSNADLTAQTPAEIDAQLAKIWGRIAVLQDAVAESNSRIRMARKCLAQGMTSYQRTIDAAEARIAELAPKIDAIKAEAEPFEAEFDRRGGWTRAFLVVTKGVGHVHRSRNCQSCFVTTEFSWMIDYSGASETEIVEAAGERACTFCYPTAPVEVLSRPTKMFSEDEKAKAARAAEREAKAAAKAAQQVIDVETGKVLFKTERGATNFIAQELGDALWYGPAHPSFGEWMLKIDATIAAVAAKRGVEFAALRAELVAKAEKKAKVKLGQSAGGYGVA